MRIKTWQMYEWLKQELILHGWSHLALSRYRIMLCSAKSNCTDQWITHSKEITKRLKGADRPLSMSCTWRPDGNIAFHCDTAVEWAVGELRGKAYYMVIYNDSFPGKPPVVWTSFGMNITKGNSCTLGAGNVFGMEFNPNE